MNINSLKLRKMKINKKKEKKKKKLLLRITR